MGTWGTGIFEDDLASDVRAEFEDIVVAGHAPEQAADGLLQKYSDEVADPDDGPVIYLAMVVLLLDSDVKSHPVYQRADEILRTGAGLERWQEDASVADLAERSAVYETIHQRLSERIKSG